MTSHNLGFNSSDACAHTSHSVSIPRVVGHRGGRRRPADVLAAAAHNQSGAGYPLQHTPKLIGVTP
jgi:hypothetical protein